MWELNFLGIGVATVAQFVIGALWYTPIFGKLWAKIHCFDQLDKKTQQQMQAEMMPLLGAQLLVTIITSVVLSVLIKALPSFSPYLLVVLVWAGFVVPTQISAVIFGGTPGKWILTKIGIMAGGSLACLTAAAAILGWLA